MGPPALLMEQQSLTLGPRVCAAALAEAPRCSLIRWEVDSVQAQGLSLSAPPLTSGYDSAGGCARWGGCSATVPTLKMLSAASASLSRTKGQRVEGITQGPFAVSRRLDWRKELGLMVHPFCWIRCWRKRVEGNKTAVSLPCPVVS